jgi:hypothetical protein
VQVGRDLGQRRREPQVGHGAEVVRRLGHEISEAAQHLGPVGQVVGDHPGHHDRPHGVEVVLERGDDPAGDRQPGGLGGMVEVAVQAAALGAGGPGRRVDPAPRSSPTGR